MSSDPPLTPEPTISEVSTGDGLILTPEQRAEYVATVRYELHANDLDAREALDALIADAEMTRKALDVLAGRCETLDDELGTALSGECDMRTADEHLAYALTEAARRLGR